MQVVTTKQELRAAVKQWRSEGLTVGLVPTMGYLHDGHKSLIQAANAQCDRVVVSIFVNPIQFGPNEDLDSYPRDLDHDLPICEDNGANVVFHPAVEEMYPEGFNTHVEVSELGDTLCGASRPIHFKGVCTVVSKLFNLVKPDKAFFGQKDAQQLAIIKRMNADLDFGIEVIGCPIVREEYGLAKSSRNTYLSPAERQAALVLSQSLKVGKEYLASGGASSAELKAKMSAHIESEPLARIDYIEVVDALNMQPVDAIEKEVLIAMAVYIGKTRLIDNMIYQP